jgi:hypothetical protein
MFIPWKLDGKRSLEDVGIDGRLSVWKKKMA